MKKSLFYGAVMAIVVACGGVKKTQKALNLGDYGQAINTSIENLAKNKSKKSNQDYVLMLEEAFQKNTERELKEIAFLLEDENPAHYETIYRSYVNLRDIQERIRPLLPLPIYDEKRNARFKFNDYQDDLLDSKDELSDHLYDKASNLLKNATSKQDYRKAYDDLVYLEEIDPGFDDTKTKMEEAFAKGQDYVQVHMVNNTDQIVPAKLQEELLNFNTYGLDGQWTQFHANPLPNIRYDYTMELALREINISPEQVNEKEIIKERQVKDGQSYALDREGNVVKDSLGNKIKIDKFKTVQCNFYQFTQFKSARVAGVVNFTDLTTQQALDSYPLSSEFIFEHVYANYDGDKRALDNDLVKLLGLASVPFPSNEQMVYDAGEDLKSRLKSILVRQRFN
ncbi:hypothetical protein SAMN05421636_104119 [Pricia antarctica]|uniref:Uncharacterized protein n=1 Tax=Pricia antarctica TaxID=641691 RepID=A0A1G7BGN1_9FLAO|nr:hypothetical protein [Pricia antarctica]SDE25385.1 hypothetical protein SAMN05421636_104119 [Pricia antarctica]